MQHLNTASNPPLHRHATLQAGEHQHAALLPAWPPNQKSFTVGGMGQWNFSTCATIQGVREKRPVIIQ